MKKRFFMLMLAFLFALPGIFILTGCGENTDNPQQKEIASLYVKYNEQSSDNIYITQDYGFSVGDIMQETEFVFVYKDGSKKVINEQNFTKDELNKLEETYLVKYYVNQEDNWVEIGNVSYSTKPDAGNYKIEFTINQKTAKVFLTVQQTELNNKTISVVIAQKDDDNWRAKINRTQTFKYEQQTHKETDNGTINSNYIAYAIDGNTDVSGTNVSQIYAIPQILNIENEIPEFWQADFNAINAKTGSNSKDVYNAIKNIEGWDAQKIKEVEHNFLNWFGNLIADKQENSQNLVVNTSLLKPGNYYLFALYEDKNHTPHYTVPYTTLNIEKGIFNLKKAVSYVGQDWNETDAQEIINHLTFAVEYYFSTYGDVFNTTDTSGNVVKALTAKYLNENYAVKTNQDDSFFTDWILAHMDALKPGALLTDTAGAATTTSGVAAW